MAFNLPYSPSGGGPSMTVNFIGNTLSIALGSTVSFTDTSSPTPTDWYWNIPSIGATTSQNPTFTFNNTGSYSVTLLAGNSNSGAVTTKSAYVYVYEVNLLDTYTGSHAAYGVHKLRTLYTGDAFVIRRSSDNATQSISYLGNGEVDETAITNFVGTHSAFIQTWFDQSGNNFHVSQNTTSRQPRIVNAGTIDKVNGKVAPYFSGLTTLTRQAGNISIKDLRFLNSVCYKLGTVLNGDFGALIATEYNDSNGFWIGYFSAQSKRWQFWAKASQYTTNTYDMNVDQQIILSKNFQTGTNNTKRWLDTQLDATVTISDLSGTSTSIFSIGGQGATNEYRWNGYIQDLVIWNRNFDDTNRIAIETKQKNYFNF